MLIKKARYIFYGLLMLIPFFSFSQGEIKAFNSGSYIINMGAEPQTIDNALKPYGLVYELIHTYKIPVDWSIRSNKILDESDFTYDDVAYKGGPFIIEEKFLSQTVKDVIAEWETKGVIGTYTTERFSAPVYATLISVPQVFIFNKNSSILKPLEYLDVNAGITNWQSGTNFDQADPCSDLVIIADTDPDAIQLDELRNFVVNGGNVFLQGKAVSRLASLTVSGGDLDLLTDGRLFCYETSQCGSAPVHAEDPTLPISYNTALGDDPIMQFLGTDLHLATGKTTAASTETWFLPLTEWNTNVRLPITTGDINPIFSNTRGAKVAYGHTFDNANNGRGLFIGGNDLNSGTAGDVAAQRLLLNFLLLTGIDQSGSLDIAGPDQLIAGDLTTFTTTVNSLTPTAYTWYTECDGTLTSTDGEGSFTPALTNNRATCDLWLVASDDCGRSAYATKTLTVYPVNEMPSAQQDDVLVIGDQSITIDALANDTDPQPDDQLSIDQITQQPVNGSVTIQNNQLVYTGTNDTYILDSLYYRVCDDGIPSLCSEARVIITNELQINSVPVVNDQTFTITAGRINEICIVGDDNENDDLEIVSLDYSGAGTLSDEVPEDLCFTYEVRRDFQGQEEITVTVCDIRENYLCTTSTILLNVELPNEAPVILDQTFEAIAGQMAQFCVEATDPDDDVIYLSIVDQGSVSATINNTNPHNLCFNYKAPAGFSGQDSFTVEICDEDAKEPLCTQATITMNVSLPNTAPVANHQTFKAIAGVETEFCVEASDESEVLTMTLIGGNSSFSDEIIDDLCFFYQSFPDFSGVEKVTVEICDTDTDNPLCTRVELTVVVETPSISISKAVTPDGNGQNDVLYIENINSYPGNSVRIFDRWGGLVFETSGYNNDTNNWDGYNGSKEAPAGTYFYFVELPESGEQFKGYVELIK